MSGPYLFILTTNSNQITIYLQVNIKLPVINKVAYTQNVSDQFLIKILGFTESRLVIFT